MASFDVALGMPITAVTHPGQAEWFMVDRLCLEDDAMMACEVERVRSALERWSEWRMQSGRIDRYGPVHRTTLRSFAVVMVNSDGGVRHRGAKE